MEQFVFRPLRDGSAPAHPMDIVFRRRDEDHDCKMVTMVSLDMLNTICAQEYQKRVEEEWGYAGILMLVHTPNVTGSPPIHTVATVALAGVHHVNNVWSSSSSKKIGKGSELHLVFRSALLENGRVQSRVIPVVGRPSVAELVSRTVYGDLHGFSVRVGVVEELDESLYGSSLKVRLDPVGLEVPVAVATRNRNVSDSK